MSESLAHHVAVQAGEGALVPTLGMTHKVGGTDLRGSLLILEGVIGPGVLVHPHTHSREDECSYVFEGVLTYLVGDVTVQVAAGGYVPKPRGVRHSFWNASDQPARVMEIHTPSTFDTYYEELGQIFASCEPGSTQLITTFDSLAERYGITVHWDQMPEMYSRSGLRPHTP